MPADLFADAGLRPAAKPLTVFRAELIGYDDATWEELFAGFTRLKAITFSSSIEFLVRLADRLDDAEIMFGSESILSKEHLARLSERQMLLRQDALGAKHDLGVVEAIRQPHQEFDAAREGDCLQPGEAGEQLLPGSVVVTDQLGAKHSQWLGGGAQASVG